MENITENNTLIAQFMGWKPYVSLGAIKLFERDGEIRSIGELDYDSSWSLLMEVVEKIESHFRCNKYSGQFAVQINGRSCSIVKSGTPPSSFNMVRKIIESPIREFSKTKKESTFNAIFRYIKLYNENK